MNSVGAVVDYPHTGSEEATPVERQHRVGAVVQAAKSQTGHKENGIAEVEPEPEMQGSSLRLVGQY